MLGDMQKFADLHDKLQNVKVHVDQDNLKLFFAIKEDMDDILKSKKPEPRQSAKFSMQTTRQQGLFRANSDLMEN